MDLKRLQRSSIVIVKLLALRYCTPLLSRLQLSLDTAQARLERPLTPFSIAGVNRRMNRRAYYGGYGGYYGGYRGYYGYHRPYYAYGYHRPYYAYGYHRPYYAYGYHPY